MTTLTPALSLRAREWLRAVMGGGLLVWGSWKGKCWSRCLGGQLGNVSSFQPTATWDAETV